MSAVSEEAVRRTGCVCESVWPCMATNSLSSVMTPQVSVVREATVFQEPADVLWRLCFLVCPTSEVR
eukprot:12009189-Prorocentrum_lima.AAC.1